MSTVCVGIPIPGPAGPQGIPGDASGPGIDGLDAFTVTDADFTMPAAAASVVVTVVENGWAFAGQVVYIQTAGYFTVSGKSGTTLLTLVNLGYTGNAVAGTVIAAANGMTPGGLQGVAGSLTGAASGDLTGNYPGPTIDLLKVTSAKMSVTGVTAGFYGSSTLIPIFGIDVAGRITSAVNAAFSAAPTGAAGGDLTGTYPNPTLLTVVSTKGGTGVATVTTGDLLYGSAANVWAKLAGVATGNALISGGVGVAPLWGKIGLTTHVSGVLDEVNGGTGGSTVATGDLLYGSALNTWARLADVATGMVLKAGGVGVAPFYGKVDLTADTTGTVLGTSVAPGTANQMLATNAGATAAEWRTLAGTANQVAVAFGAGTVTLSAPQNIDSAATPTFANAAFSGLTANRLVGKGATNLASVANLQSWIAGTTNQVATADDGDGSITLSLPQNIHTGAFPTFDGALLTDASTVSTNSVTAAASTALTIDHAIASSTASIAKTGLYVNLTQSWDGATTSALGIDIDVDSTNTAVSYGLFVDVRNALTSNYAIYTTRGALRLGDSGQAFGVLGATPVVQPAAYTITNVTPDRSCDADTVAVAELADIVGTLIADLRAYGFLA